PSIDAARDRRDQGTAGVGEPHAGLSDGLRALRSGAGAAPTWVAADAGRLSVWGASPAAATRKTGHLRVWRRMRPTYSPMMPSTRSCPAPRMAMAAMIDVQPATVWPIQRKLTIE